jgi:hypothetical protein
MLFLVELDHVKSGSTPTPEAGAAFIEQIIFPSLARGEQLVSEKKILAGGPVVGRIGLRAIVEAGSLEEIDRIISGFPLWSVAETRVTPLTSFGERRKNIEKLLEALRARGSKPSPT